MHSPWISRLLAELGHEVIGAYARNVRLIGESRKKDDRLNAHTLARLAGIDPQLLMMLPERRARPGLTLAEATEQHAVDTGGTRWRVTIRFWKAWV